MSEETINFEEEPTTNENTNENTNEKKMGRALLSQQRRTGRQSAGVD